MSSLDWVEWVALILGSCTLVFLEFVFLEWAIDRIKEKEENTAQKFKPSEWN